MSDPASVEPKATALPDQAIPSADGERPPPRQNPTPLSAPRRNERNRPGAVTPITPSCQPAREKYPLNVIRTAANGNIGSVDGPAAHPYKPRSTEHHRLMANTKSAKKAARQSARRTVINRTRRSRLRTAVREVEEAIAAGDRSRALAAMAEAEPVIVRAAQKNVVHRNAARRKVSRLAHRIAELEKS